MPEDTTHIPSIRYLGATTDGRLYWTPWPNAIPGEPKVLTNPTISGIVAPGQTVYAVPGTYTGSPMPTLRRRVWTLYDAAGEIFDEAILLNEGVKIPSNAPTGKLLLQEVVFGVAELKAVGAVEVFFSAIPGLPVFTRAPTISGNATVGNVLTAVHGAATGSPAPVITGQWYRGTTATGVTALSYTTTSADIGGVMTYRDRANNTAGDAYSFSASITIVAVSQAAPVFTVAPTISVTAGGTFTCSTGTVAGNPTPTLTYLWFLSDTATGTLNARDGGATTVPNTWTPSQSSFPDKFFACQVTANNGIGTPAVVMTARMQRPVQEGFTTNSTLSGGAPQGSTLTLNAGAWCGAPTEIEPQVFRISSTGVATLLENVTISADKKTTTRKTGADDFGNTIAGRVRIKYASGSEFFSPSATTYTTGIVVTAAVAWPALDGFAAVGVNKGGNVLDKPYIRFEDAYSSLKSEKENSNHYHHAAALAGYEAWRGNTAANAYLEGAIKYVLTTGNEPNIMMNYGAMYPYAACCAMYFASVTPAVWAKFTSTQKTQIDVIMKLAAIAAAAVARNDSTDTHKSMTGEGGANATTLEESSNPNIRMPHYAFPQLLCSYMGASAADAFLKGVTETSIKALRDSVVVALPRIGLAFANTRPSGAPKWDKIVSKSVNYDTGGARSHRPYFHLQARDGAHVWSERIHRAE